MTLIRGLRRLDHTARHLNIAGDNWHSTWASNDAQYVALCDGSGGPDIVGYTGKVYNSRVYRLEGDPPTPVFVDLPGFPDLESVSGTLQSSRYYGFGILALDEHIYHYLSMFNNHPSYEPNLRFIGAKLIYSPDHGQTWRNQDGAPICWEPWDERSRDNMVFFAEPGEAFSLLTCLQMGKNYEHNRDGYIYLYAPNGSRDGTMNQLVLARVRSEQILDRSAYEFFVSRSPDGSATWSTALTERGVVHTFPAGWVNTQIHPYAWQPSVAYNAPLGCYMMANWGMGCAPDGMWFGKPSYLGFWVAEQPWGQWEQIHEETAWTPLGDQAARAYQPQINPKWIAGDGRSFWLVWTDFQEIGEQRPKYIFNYQQVEIDVV